MTFPQIVVGKRSIGGFRELLEADRAGTLEELLGRPYGAAWRWRGWQRGHM